MKKKEKKKKFFFALISKKNFCFYFELNYYLNN